MGIRLEIRKSRFHRSPQGLATSFLEIDHEIFSAVILSIPLIQERQLVSGERKCTSIGQLLREL